MGKIYQSIPWVELCKSLKIRDNRKGRTSLFTPQGKLALMFLKSYTCFYDKKLIENLNGNLYYQLFCGVFLGLEKLVDFKIISRIRTQISAKLDIPVCQGILANAWKPYIDHPNVLLEDATCYESYIRYPTNVKLL